MPRAHSGSRSQGPGDLESFDRAARNAGALLARTWYLGDGAGLDAWQRQVLDGVRTTVKPIEPPVLDSIAAASFRLTGKENFWVPRLVASLCWVVGGIFLYLIALRVTRREGAIVALSLYLFWPYGVWLSRLFMPDALLVALLLAGALTVIRYWEEPSRRRLWIAGVVSSLAVAAKPGVALLFLVALFLALAVATRGLRASIVGGRFLLYVALTLSLTAAYFVAGTRIAHFISPGASTRRVTPGPAAGEEFWGGWWRMVSYVSRYPQPQSLLALVPLLAALAGLLVTRRGVPRAIVGGLAIGYVAFGLAFANYTSTHPYYSLALIPIVSLAIGALAGAILDRFEGSRPSVRWALFAGLVCVVCLAGLKAHAVLTGPPARARIADYRAIGRITDHTTRALIVDRQLATPAMYWGWIVGRNWELDYDETLPTWLHRTDFDYLVVVGVEQLETSRASERSPATCLWWRGRLALRSSTFALRTATREAPP